VNVVSATSASEIQRPSPSSHTACPGAVGAVVGLNGLGVLVAQRGEELLEAGEVDLVQERVQPFARIHQVTTSGGPCAGGLRGSAGALAATVYEPQRRVAAACRRTPWQPRLPEPHVGPAGVCVRSYAVIHAVGGCARGLAVVTGGCAGLGAASTFRRGGMAGDSTPRRSVRPRDSLCIASCNSVRPSRITRARRASPSAAAVARGGGGGSGAVICVVPLNYPRWPVGRGLTDDRAGCVASRSDHTR
jgi:hypothetical protein